jgi:phenylacetate-CoA ligase
MVQAMIPSIQHRQHLRGLSRRQLGEYQLDRLNRLLDGILPVNPFYADKLAGHPTRLDDLRHLSKFPFTTKEDLLGAGGGTYSATNRTFPLERYVRFHRTSGTRGRPLVVLDTAEDWQWWIDCWQYVLDAADVGAEDRALVAFSYGPFIGFWSAHDALAARGALVIPSGGMSTLARIELIDSSRATAVFSTPTYALRMAEVAREHGIRLGSLGIRRLIVMGEPGGSVASLRERIQEAWGVAAFDHGGATEVGPWGYGDPHGDGMWVIESEFIAEFISVERGEAAEEGELSHLVLTSLGRRGSPVIRYRTGDLVRPRWDRPGSSRFVFLEGGILGRADDMVIVRGVNIFPSSVEQILHTFPEVVEYRLTARRVGSVDQLLVEVEDRLQNPGRIAEELYLRLGLKVEVREVPLGTLPRHEGKGRRFVDERT